MLREYHTTALWGQASRLAADMPGVVPTLTDMADTVPEEPREPLTGRVAMSEISQARLAKGQHPSSMVDTPGRLVTWLVGWLLASVDFGRRSSSSLRDAQQRATVIHVMRSRSIIDYIYFNVAFLREGIRIVRFANEISTWFMRPFWRGIRALLRGRRGLPSDVDCFTALVGNGEPTMLFLSRPRRADREDTEFSVPFLAAVVELARAHDSPVLIVPQLLVWDRRPDSDRVTLLDEMLGTRQDPGFVKRIVYIFQSAWQSFLNLGEPTVQISSGVDIHEFIARHNEASALHVARLLRDHLYDVFEREQRVIVGPGIKSARTLRDEILADPRTKEAMLEIADANQIDRTTLVKNARKLLLEIAADFNLLAVKCLSAILTPVWNRIYDGIELDQEGLDRVRKTALESRIVIVPSHKSHIDYLIISFLFYRNGLIPPHIAAGINLAFWPLGPIFRRSGAFFLRRSFAGDPLYPILFNAYLVKLLEEGFSIEFFIEGTRSRTGKLNTPRYGMLNMIVDAFRSGDVDKLAFVPVSVGYENIIEGNSYRKELSGGEKKGESIGDLLKASSILTSRYGRVYVEFGEPIQLSSFLETYHDDDNIDRTDLDRSVRRLAYRIIHGINDVTTVTPSALASLLLLNAPNSQLSRDALTREAGFCLAFLKERQARLSSTLRDAVNVSMGRIGRATRTPIDPKRFDEFDLEYVDAVNQQTDAHTVVADGDRAIGEAILRPLEQAFELLRTKKLVEIRSSHDKLSYSVTDDRRIELAFYKNNIIHYFIPEAVFATALHVAGSPSSDIDDVRAHTRFLSRLFKYEFCFKERSEFDAVFDATAEYFVQRGWMHRDPDGRIRRTSPTPAGAEFLRGLIVPTLESYRIAASFLPRLQGDAIEEKNLTRRTAAHARSLATKGELIHPESVSRATFENAWRVFREWGVLVQQHDTVVKRKTKTMHVAKEYQGALVEELHDEICALVSAQVRSPGELLRRV